MKSATIPVLACAAEGRYCRHTSFNRVWRSPMA